MRTLIFYFLKYPTVDMFKVEANPVLSRDKPKAQRKSEYWQLKFQITGYCKNPV